MHQSLTKQENTFPWLEIPLILSLRLTSDFSYDDFESYNGLRLFLGQAFRLHKQKECISPLIPGNDLKHVSGPCRLFVIRITSSLNIRCMRFRLEAGRHSSAYAKERAHQVLLLARGLYSSSAWEVILLLNLYSSQKTMEKVQEVIEMSPILLK